MHKQGTQPHLTHSLDHPYYYSGRHRWVLGNADAGVSTELNQGMMFLDFFVLRESWL